MTDSDSLKTSPKIKAVLFDFGGVITQSPFEAFTRYEKAVGAPEGIIRKINSANPNENAWAQMERNEVSIDQFCELFEQEAVAAGFALSGQSVLQCLSGDIRPQMVTALKVLKDNIRVGCITNNMKSGHGSGMSRTEDQASAVAEVMTLFEVVIESAKVGLRKPDPRIYQLACERMEIDPIEAVYLDDLGINCKPAAALGMSAIKVVDPDVAIQALEQLVGFSLS